MVRYTTPLKTCMPWKPVRMKKVAPKLFLRIDWPCSMRCVHS